jgi:hypothetical protein
MHDLEKVAHSMGKTKQRFLADLVLHEIAQFKEVQKVKKQPIGSSPVASTTDTGGLGIAAALMRNKEGKERAAEQPAPAAPVVVNVGNGNNSQSAGTSTHLSDLDRLALYVIKGDEFLRDARKRTIIEVLRASSTTDEEFNVLVAQLEQIIAVKDKIVEDNGPVNKLARFAFSKLNELLRGD